MRKLAVLVVLAASLAAFPASAGATPPICQSTACTDPVGHLLGPLDDAIGDLISPRP